MTSAIRKFIGARIKLCRTQKKLTQAALAEVLGCEVTTLGRYERGEFAPDGEQLVILAQFFKISPMDFLPCENDISRQMVIDLRKVLIDSIFLLDDAERLRQLISMAQKP